jgi:hypothetical protein
MSYKPHFQYTQGSALVGTEKGNIVHGVYSGVSGTVSPLNMINPSFPNAAFGTKGVRVLIGPTDPISNLPVFIPYDHHQIHEGETWRHNYWVASMASGAYWDMRIVCYAVSAPSGITTVERAPHLRFQVVGDSSMDILFYENPTWTNTGTTGTIVNQERNGTYTPQLAIYDSGVVNATGDLLFRAVIFTTKTSAGIVEDPTDEFILKSSTSYALRLFSKGAAANALVRIVWYEDLGV